MPHLPTVGYTQFRVFSLGQYSHPDLSLGVTTENGTNKCSSSLAAPKQFLIVSPDRLKGHGINPATEYLGFYFISFSDWDAA